MAKHKIRVRKWRATGRKHKKNRLSVAERKRIKRLLARQERKANVSSNNNV